MHISMTPEANRSSHFEENLVIMFSATSSKDQHALSQAENTDETPVLVLYA